MNAFGAVIEEEFDLAVGSYGDDLVDEDDDVDGEEDEDDGDEMDLFEVDPDELPDFDGDL